MTIEAAKRSLAERYQSPLSPREQLALTLLADEWSHAQLQMTFEVTNPEVHISELSQDTVRAIARFEVER